MRSMTGLANSKGISACGCPADWDVAVACRHAQQTRRSQQRVHRAPRGSLCRRGRPPVAAQALRERRAAGAVACKRARAAGDVQPGCARERRAAVAAACSTRAASGGQPGCAADDAPPLAYRNLTPSMCYPYPIGCAAGAAPPPAGPCAGRARSPRRAAPRARPTPPPAGSQPWRGRSAGSHRRPAARTEEGDLAGQARGTAALGPLASAQARKQGSHRLTSEATREVDKMPQRPR